MPDLTTYPAEDRRTVRALRLLRVACWGLVLMAGSLTGSSYAAESDPDAASDDVPVEAEQTDAEADAAPTRNDDAPSPEIFIPTEEISEDFAVPFPVDI